MPKSSSKVNILEGDFDSRFDGLWERARHDYPAITRRDAAVLNWRYRRHPDTAYVVLTLEDAGVLSGYVVYSIVFRHRQRRAFIVDALAHYGDFAALRCLIATALQQMRQVNVHKVECYGGGEMFASALRACGFAPRIKKGKDQPTMARRLPSVDLYITRGDGDGG